MELNASYTLLPFLLFFLVSCGNRTTEQPQTKTETENNNTVLVSNPVAHSFNTALQMTGTAKPNQVVKLHAMTNGFIKQLKTDLGDFVKEGQTVAVLENPELYRDKEKMTAELNAKRSIYERLNSIWQKTPQLTTIAEVEKAEAEYKMAKAQLDALLLQISYLNVRAPFSGVVVNRYVDKGAVIQNGLNNSNALPLFEIQDLQPLRLAVDIPETDAALIQKGSKVYIDFPELPNARYAAAISRMAYGLNETTKTMTVEIDLPNHDLKIRPGMYAKVAVERSGHKDVLSVPNEAISNIKGQSFVYVVHHNLVKKVIVQTGIHDEAYTELLNAGITSTDSVVIRGKAFCSEGATVQAQLFMHH